MVCLYVHVCLKVRLCLKMQFSASFDTTLHAEEQRGGGRVKLTQCDTDEWDEKGRYAKDALLEWSYG